MAVLGIPSLVVTVVICCLSFPTRSESYDAKMEESIEEALRTSKRATLTPGKVAGSSIPRKEVCTGPKKCPYCYPFSIRGLLSEFKFSYPAKGKPRAVLVQSRKIRNNCTDNLLSFVSYSQNVTHNYSWTFKEALQSVQYLSMESAVPPIPGSESPRVISYGPGRKQRIQASEAVTHQGQSHVVIPPLHSKNVKLTLYWMSRGFKIPFEASVQFSSIPQTACTKCSGESGKCIYQNSSSEGVLQFLKENHFKGTVLETTKYFVKGKLHGVFSGDYVQRVELTAK